MDSAHLVIETTNRLIWKSKIDSGAAFHLYRHYAIISKLFSFNFTNQALRKVSRNVLKTESSTDGHLLLTNENKDGNLSFTNPPLCSRLKLEFESVEGGGEVRRQLQKKGSWLLSDLHKWKTFSFLIIIIIIYRLFATLQN